MTNDAILVLQCLFQTIWRLFTAWHIPGTQVTPAAMALFLLIAVLSLRFLFRLLGMGAAPEPGEMSGAYATTRYLRDRFGTTRNKQLGPGKNDGIGG